MERTNWLRKEIKRINPQEVWMNCRSVDPSGRVGSGLNDFSVHCSLA